MATKQTIKKTIAKTRSKAKPAVRKVTRTVKAKAVTTTNPVKNAVLAGLSAAERMQKRVQDQTTRIYGGMVDVIS